MFVDRMIAILAVLFALVSVALSVASIAMRLGWI